MSEKIPKGWKWVKLGEVGIVITGKTPSSKHPEDWGYDMPFVTPTDYKNYRKFAYDSERYLSNAGINKLKNKVLPENSVLVTCIGSDMGKVVINKLPVITNQQINSIIPNRNIIFPDFLYYVLVYNYETLRIFASNGTAVPILNKTDFENIEISTPPLPDQKAIAEVLSSIDDKIELLHRQNKTLEEMAMTLFRQWFIEPTKDGLPEGWKEVEIGDILKETIGGDWGENKKFEGSIPVFCLRGIDLDNIKIYGHSNSVPIRYISKDSLEKRKLTENQILLAGSGIGPIGKTLPIHRKMINSFNLPVIYSNFCKRLEAKNKEIAYYMEFFIFYMYKNGELDQFHSGTSIPNFNMKNFLKLKIYFPPIIDIIKFSNFLDMFYSKKFSPQIQTLEKLRDTLLPKLMSGEIRIMKDKY